MVLTIGVLNWDSLIQPALSVSMVLCAVGFPTPKSIGLWALAVLENANFEIHKL